MERREAAATTAIIVSSDRKIWTSAFPVSRQLQTIIFWKHRFQEFWETMHKEPRDNWDDGVEERVGSEIILGQEP